MSKKIIGTFYGLGILPYLLIGLGVWLTWIDWNNSMQDSTYLVNGVQHTYVPTYQPFLEYMMSPGNMVFFSICLILGSAFEMIAWIGTLINLGKAHKWTWFLLVLFFGGIVVLIYLFAGPRPLKAGQDLQTQLALDPALPSYQPGTHPQMPPFQANQLSQSPSALTILQQRYARGEIDTATYEQMRNTLNR
ncbi:MAG: SHOCT domain-containing protein [Ktedonobacteraceae bacterium]|nr:SHOCT domain-containing protein [Ktedonobacteraceae bacterium]